MSAAEERYLGIVLEAIRVCGNYKPKFGHAKEGGFDLKGFEKLYRADSFYSWFGLDNPLMYAAHKAAGGMTSIYRQIGIGCEKLFRALLQDQLGLSEADSRWSYAVPQRGNRTRRLSLDGRIPVAEVKSRKAKKRIQNWISSAAASLDIKRRVASSLGGTVFEVRQGYKSKDSKRQNADIANAATAYTQGYLPCLVILSTQIDDDIALRYRAEKWLVLTGNPRATSPLESSYAFASSVLDFDLAGFFERNSGTFRKEIDQVLYLLLSPK